MRTYIAVVLFILLDSLVYAGYMKFVGFEPTLLGGITVLCIIQDIKEINK
jgi:hypothetical protein